ncbi:MAG: hypothetical protein K9G33_08160 [Sneathiella sp.]|nr:hypothetical protein [Sneathiella sp.]
MVSIKEITWSLYGNYLIARRDKDALHYFNISEAGFYSSFTAMVLAIPFFAFENGLDYKTIATETALIPFLLLLCLALWVSWGAFLFVMGILSKFMGFADKISVFVIVYNWSQLALIALWMPISIISGGLLPAGIASGINLLFIAASYVYLWQILRVTLNLTGTTAAGLAFLEFLVAVLTQSVFSKWLFTAPL